MAGKKWGGGGGGGPTFLLLRHHILWQCMVKSCQNDHVKHRQNPSIFVRYLQSTTILICDSFVGFTTAAAAAQR